MSDNERVDPLPVGSVPVPYRPESPGVTPQSLDANMQTITDWINKKEQDDQHLKEVQVDGVAIKNDGWPRETVLKIPDGYYKSGTRLLPSEALAHKAVRILLQYVGDDPDRDGLRDTPARVCKSLRELCGGLEVDPLKLLERQFDLVHDEMMLLKDIPFTSVCEHHMLPFSGVAHVAYIPRPAQMLPRESGQEQRAKVVGLSKLARLVHAYARRLQVQERLTGEVADALVKVLDPLGAACIISAEHSCMSCRGIKLSGTSFITSAMRGVFKEDDKARAELMTLCRG